MRDHDGSSHGHLRVADLDVELDETLVRAIDAWRELGPDGTGPSPEDELDDGFLDRVMAAEAARAEPRVVGLSVDLPAVAAVSVGGSRRRTWLAGLGAVAASIAGLLALSVPADPSSRPAAAGDTVDALAASAGPAVAGAGLEVPELSAEGTPGQPMPHDLGAQVEAYVADYGRNYGPTFKFHGVIVVARAGEVLYQQGFGQADASTGEPNTVDTRFRLGLLTEPLTATAILQLREEGQLQLDDTIERFLPEFPRSNRITIRDLLVHRSGIPNYTNGPFFHEWKGTYHSTAAMLERLGKLRPLFAAGTGTLPSNSNYYLLGAIIERISGQSYGEYMATHVFEPAGMVRSTFGDAWETGEQARGNVWGDDETLEPPAPIDMSTFGAAGGLVSSPADLVAWDRAMRAGELLGPGSLEEMATPTVDGYGCGWLVTRAYGQQLLSFPGAIDGYSGSMLRFAEDDTLVVVLANTEVVPGAQVAQDIAMLVHGDTPPKRNEPAEVSIAPGTYYKYTGTFGISPETRQAYADMIPAERFDLLSTVRVEQEDERLYFDVPGHGRTWMHPMGRNRFFFKDHTGNKVSFELGRDKRAVRMIVHEQGARFELDRKSWR